jgi:hypothetical protein
VVAHQKYDAVEIRAKAKSDPKMKFKDKWEPLKTLLST